ncbi:DUF1320 domain-containing protein [Pedobacter sp. D749]|uniref:DUF1320 domain-containing protein n=1 Tax=Pedobacter sp. D749 TaxID=2856523 RepID=UPI001C58DF19|nr:DUF1320 domain-containing protein [Pedobacter sp. D749]QXU42080.1 DUF1320 domain-containing protein [Pedobacter sp. D749]
MDFITKQDFLTHMYEGSIDAISDNDDEILNDAIATAMAEASGYLSRFNTDIIFVSEDKIKYANLRAYIKDMSKWHFINICNVNVDMEIAEKRYKAALAELGKIQSGRTVPKAWPLADEDLLELYSV